MLSVLKPTALIPAGKFQRSLSFVAGVSGLLGGCDVALEHYKGSYGQRVMYTPVVLSGLLFVAGCAGAVRPKYAQTLLPISSALLIADGAVGFAFHVRGIHRKPGGWQQLPYNLVMGPPLFAPLLLGIGGWLGLMASMLRPETGEAVPSWPASSPVQALLPASAVDALERTSQAIRHGRCQRALCAATSISAALNGFEATVSHYGAGFQRKSQWLPVAVAPALTVAGLAAWRSPKAAKRSLPVVSALALATGSAGFFFHLAGVKRRPGGFSRALYNLTYGPPMFAPLLFAASGFMGLLASRMRR